MIGSTDNHAARPGDTSEEDFGGGHGTADDEPEEQLSAPWITFNPGGLAGVWAPQNTRRAIFAALKRREVFATSGTRMAVRMFAGPLSTDLCGDADAVGKAYSEGVPMGGTLTATTAPTFMVMAAPDINSNALEEIQIVKSWYDGSQLQETVVKVLEGAELSGQACVTWTDTTFDSSDYHVYYARVFETPKLRWSTRVCAQASVDCQLGAPEGFEHCCDSTVAPLIRERAWSSPIWYTPQGGN